MHLLWLLPALTLLPVSAPPSVDLTRVERIIVKEPVYRTKSPRYCLLLFGPAAKTRVWVVVDGTDIYIDKNGDGDLTAPDEKFANDGEGFKPFEITDRAGPDRYVIRRILIDSRDTEWQGIMEIKVEIKGKYRQTCTPVFVLPEEYARKDPPAAIPVLGTKPQHAPLCHFHGPLTMRIDTVHGMQKLAAGDKPSELLAGLGTFDHAQGCAVFVVTHWRERVGETFVTRLFPTDVTPIVHPVAEIEFPAQQPGGAPIRELYELPERC